MGAISEKDFEDVKAFITKNFPEFSDVRLQACEECEEMYIESLKKQSKKELPARTYAHTLHIPNVVCYTERMDTELSEAQRKGIFIHEFGHLFDERYPETAEMYADGDDREVVADMISFAVFRVPIDYGDYDIQEVDLPLREQVDDESAEEILTPDEDDFEEDEDEEDEEITPVKVENMGIVEEFQNEGPIIDTKLNPTT